MQEIRKLNKVERYFFPGIGEKSFKEIESEIYKTKDEKAFFLLQNSNVVVYFPTNIGITAYYEFKKVKTLKKINAVLMDLDGTSVKSERFWMWVIEEVARRLLKNDSFELDDADFPFVSGFSVSEHLKYIITKYCSDLPDATLSKAQRLYFEIVHIEMEKILKGEGKEDAFVPAPHLKEFLLNLKKNGIKVGLVSSGLYEKAWPEIISAFEVMGFGDPLKYYDTIVTAGFSIKKGQAGTLGELEPKPHPWLYTETLFALHIPVTEAVAIEDSGAGILAIRSAGIPAIGVGGGNIESGGELPLCSYFGESLKDAWNFIEKYL